MNLIDHRPREGEVQVNYTRDDVFKAAYNALKESQEFEVSNANKVVYTIELKVGMSWLSWGENIVVSMHEGSTGTFISVLSAPKTGTMGILDSIKNRTNVSKIINIISEELKKYKEISSSNSNNKIALELKQLAELKESGLIREDEFEQKRRQILGLPDKN